MELEQNFKWIKPSVDKEAKIRKLIKGKHLKFRFDMAVKNNIPWLLQECFDKGYKCNIWGANWAIGCAAYYDLYEVFKILLINVQDFYIDFEQAIYWPLSKGNIETIKLLIEDVRFDYNITMGDILYKPILLTNHFEIIKLFIDNGNYDNLIKDILNLKVDINSNYTKNIQNQIREYIDGK